MANSLVTDRGDAPPPAQETEMSEALTTGYRDAGDGSIVHKRFPMSEGLPAGWSDTYSDCKNYNEKDRSNLRPVQAKDVFAEAPKKAPKKKASKKD